MKIIFVLTLLPWLCGFTLLSGPDEAKLPATPDDPEIVFYWDGSHPKIDEQDKFRGGRYEKLNDEEFMSHLISESFAVWNDVKGSYLKLKIKRDDDVEVDDEDEKNVIVVDEINLVAAALAKPMLSDDRETITDCDISLGDKTFKAMFLANAIVHELGHCIGLGHNHSNRKSIMGYTRGDNNTWLSADDKAGVIYLYTDPEYDSGDKQFIGCSTISGPLAERPSTSLLMLLLLAMPLLVLFHRRSSRQ